MEGRMTTLEEKFEQQTSEGEIMALLKAQEQGRGPGSRDGGYENGDSSHSGTRSHLKFTPKLEFPSFDGSNPRIWMKKCLKYFNLCKIPEEQRVDLASMYMVGRAESWFNSYIVVRQHVEWHDFIVDLCARFKEDIAGNVVEEFNKLRQTGTIDDYLDAFENLKGLMIQRNPLLPEQYFLDSFIGGLKSSLKPFVKAFKPRSLAAVVEYARLQEESLAVTKFTPKQFTQNSASLTKPVPFQQSFANRSNFKGLLPTPPSHNTQQIQNTAQRPTKFISAAERAEKLKKGECYFCSEPYDINHNCKFKGTQMFAIEIVGVEDDEQEDPGMVEEVEESDLGYEMVGTVPCISMNALSGSSGFQMGKKAIHILINSGSTHNFLAQEMAARVGCKLDTIEPQSVTVADGSQFPCQLMSKQFSWQLQNTQFVTDVLIIPLGGCDMILGVQWLSTLGTVSWNFKNLKMEFKYKDKRHVLRAVAKYHSEDAIRVIMRLEQNAHSYMQRAIASHGAFAILYGRHSKHYIKKPEVLLGRGTDDIPVDIDLSREGRAN
ncbi:hypothetical protein KSS87_015381, partial [Heliosperma pusillum]